MQQIKGNLWDYHKEGSFIIIPTNGIVTNAGLAVMGAGIAKQAADKYPHLAKQLGSVLKAYGNFPFFVPSVKIITFPVKEHWREKGDYQLIRRSCERLVHALETTSRKTLLGFDYPIYLPKVGCGNGQLKWERVRPILEEYFEEDKFIVVDVRT